MRYTVKWSLVVDGNVVEFHNPFFASLPRGFLPPPFPLPSPITATVISGCRLHRGRQNRVSSSFLPKLHLYKSLRGPTGGRRRDRTWLIGKSPPPPPISHFAHLSIRNGNPPLGRGGERCVFDLERMKFLS